MPEPHWLDQYGSPDRYAWRSTTHHGQPAFHRPLGLVEFAFDGDSRYFAGRSDINLALELAIRTDESSNDVRKRITLAWTCLRFRHALIQAKALLYAERRAAGVQGGEQGDVHFVVTLPDGVEDAVEQASTQLVFLDDHYEHIDLQDFWCHVQNCAGLIDQGVALAKLFILPFDKDGKTMLRFLMVGGHQIQDGLTNYVWMADFIRLLNRSLEDLQGDLLELVKPESVRQRLPPPQDALYPPISGSRARQRWFWLLTRILRHVRKPLPAGFANPLHRRQPLSEAVAPSPVYQSVLDYTSTPVVNTRLVGAAASPAHTARLHRICREAGVSIGAGGFALAALLMMEAYERREPHIPPHERKPFIAGFPLNPRPFLVHGQAIQPDSVMLAFCDGILLPFLPSDLPLSGRLRLLARQAQRQLALYQKRVRPSAERDAGASLQYMSSRGAGRMLAIQYLSGFERAASILPPELLKDRPNPQGAYPMRPNATRQTCGVSSVGRTDGVLRPGMYDLEATNGKGFVADYRGLHAGVRAREGEFLVGIAGSDKGLSAGVSVDTSAADPVWVQWWQERFDTILDDSGSDEARL